MLPPGPAMRDSAPHGGKLCSEALKHGQGSHVGMFSLYNCSSPYYQHGLTLIPTWICDHIHYKLWDEITYSFLHFNGATIEV